MEQRAGHQVRRFLGVALVLALLLPLTWGLRAWRLAEVRGSVEARQAGAVAAAFVHAERQFAALQADMLVQARALAEAPPVGQALRSWVPAASAVPPEAVVQFFAGQVLPERRTVELYDTTGHLLAWSGYHLAADALPALAALQGAETAVASDGTVRRGLVLWWPVREAGRTLGAVRVVELIAFRAPVENQYLSNYYLEEDWQRITHLPTFLQYEEAPPQPDIAHLPSRLLQGVDGRLLARVYVEPPTPARLLETAARRFDDVLAFWAALLLFWLVAGLWSWYGALDRVAPGETVHHWLLQVAGRFGLAAAAWWGVRYLLLMLRVPGRWQPGQAPLSPLFDPTHLASTLGGGLMRSTGDLFLTALFALLFAAAFLHLAAHFREKGADLYGLRTRLREKGAEAPSPVRFFAVVGVAGLLVLGLSLMLAALTRHAILDSQLAYFERTGLVPEPMVLVVFCTLLLITVAVVLLTVGLGWVALWLLMRYWPGWPRRVVLPGLLLAVALPIVGVYLLFEIEELLPVAAALAFVAAGSALAVFGFTRREDALNLLALRNVLPALFLLTLLLYPMFYQGMATQRRLQMLDAADLFSEGRDPRVLFAIEQVLREARSAPVARAALATAEATGRQARLDSLATILLRHSLLAALGPYDLSLTFFDPGGTPLGRYEEAGQSFSRAALDRADAAEFEIIRQMYADSEADGVMVDKMTGRQPDRFQYTGIVPVGEAEERVGWAVARAEPQAPLGAGGTPFPRVLMPASIYGSLYENLSLAEFREGVLVRSFGRDFGRYRLAEPVRELLVTHEELWRTEQVEERRFVTYYRRLPQPLLPASAATLGPSVSAPVTAVRVPAISTFDHLYYLLRLTVAGLFIGLPLYVLGLYLRRRAGLLPAPRVRFRDKVLSAFLGVGIVTVAAVGFVGLQVVTGETERAIQSWLRDRLEQVEEMLLLEQQGNELPYRTLSRLGVDSLAAQVGLDLNIYAADSLVASSRPQLVRDRIIDARLPIRAYEALFYSGFRFTYTEEQVGRFTYTAGFRTLLDEEGQPRYVISLPTLPEQERIEEERARTVAYLFGALLLLVLVVMLTASLLANALARPIGRLRAGLQEVAKGHFERTLPVDTRDEIGDLVQTFNEMQEQLAESRRKLAQQERQLAWREMARQVAHEIKNPLTPMKLSVQHLRRAYDSLEASGDGAEAGQPGRFSSLFERITGTLIEQIDALNRIANEFSTFARLPTRMIERLDLNAVIREAMALMQEEEPDAEFVCDLHAEALVLEADREELRRIFINLLKNALQAIPEERAGRIEVVTQLMEGDGPPSAYATVSDNGTGILAELRDKIFTPNFSTKTSGTGLGLAIVKKGIEELQGEIGFETEEGAGTTFWIRLPLAEE